MKTIGIVAVTPIGGMQVFEKIFKDSKRRFNGVNPPMVLECKTTHEYIDAMKSGQKEKIVELLLDSITKLQNAGADFAIIPNNAVMGVLDEVRKRSPIEVLHTTDLMVEACEKKLYRKVCLFAPTPVIGDRVYEEKLKEIELIIPSVVDQEKINSIIMETTKKGRPISDQEKEVFYQIFDKMKHENPFDALIAGCGENYVSKIKDKGELPVLNPFDLLSERALEVAVNDLLTD